MAANISDATLEALRDKWDYGIDIQKATDKELNKYVKAKAIIYEKEKICDMVLWEVYKTDFKQ